MFYRSFIKKVKQTPLLKQVFSRRGITIKTLLKLGLFLVVGVVIFVVGLFAWYGKDLPRPGELRHQSISESTILYDRTGKQIYDISGDEHRILIKSGEIPPTVKQAVVAIEDKNFYHHHGVDFRGILRGTILRPLTGHGIQGGSTITQQYVKNALLSPQRSVTRKIKEIILALELEFLYKKDDILTMYLNEVPYGSNIYGIEAASQAYFGKSAKDGLTLAQGATLAAIPNAPTRYSPYGSHIDELMARKNIVLDDMAKNGYITQEAADKAKKESPLEAKDFAQKRDNFPAPHFVMYVREILAQKYGEDVVQRGGLRVTTTLDLDMQGMADSAVKDSAKVLSSAKATNAGLVAIDPKTGQLLAMVGSVDYFDRDHEGNFNVATAKRQPGSAGKPIVYATLFNKGKWGPGSVMWDVETDFNGYKPGNFDGKFHGPLRIRSALGNSFNIPAVKALQLAGLNDFIDTATNMGITTLANRKDAGLSLALGGGEVKLVDLVAAYGVFANGGEQQHLTSILRIQDSSGKVLHEWKPSPKQAIKPEIAYEINNILSDTEAKKPTFGRLLNVLSVSGKTVAVKTGTTNSFKDAWTLGYTPTLAAGVWAGNNNNTEMDHGGGSTVAAPIWHNFMVKALASKGNEPFYRPSTISDHTVDLLSGKNPTPASGQLVQDIFAPWQLPTDNDDLHNSVKVCKSNGFLAIETTPPEEVEEKVFTKVRSEWTDNPAWENPVQAWAKGQNLVSDPPTQKCDITASNPKVKITSPTSGDTVSGIFTVAADASFPPNVSGSVEFAVDGKAITTATSEPYNATIDSSTLGVGNHQVTATARGTNGTSASDTIAVVVGSNPQPPNEVTNVTLQGLAGGQANATWRNPADLNLATITFYASQASGIKGVKVTTVPATPGADQSTILTGLIPKIPNYITFVPTDKTGNSNPTTKQYSVTPP